MNEQIGISIDADEFSAVLDCPICFSGLKNPVMTPCGHTYCKDCIDQCLSRGPECPVCKGQVAPDQLKKNFLIEQIQRQLENMKNKVKGHVVDNMLQLEGGEVLNRLMPILKRHLSDSIIKFEQYCNSTLHEQEACKRRIKAKFADRLLKETKEHVDPNIYQQLKNQEAAELVQVEETTQQIKKSLIEAYEQYLNETIPEPKILPIKIELSVPSRKINLAISVKPFEALQSLKIIVEKYIEKGGDAIISWEPDIHFMIFGLMPLVNGNANSMEEVKEGTIIKQEEFKKTFGELNVLQGTKIEVRGTIKLDSEIIKPCLSLTYRKGDGKKYNYYMCFDCGLNWLCEPCLKQCHKGHSTKSFLQNFNPTYGCCYCTKKSCIIPNKANAQENGPKN